MPTYSKIHLRVLAVLSLITITPLLFVQPVSAASMTLYPTGDGTTLAWSFSGDTSHYKNIDDVPCNNDADYNYTTHVGDMDKYIVALPLTTLYGKTITSVDVYACAAAYYGTVGTSSTLKLWYGFNNGVGSDVGENGLSDHINYSLVNHAEATNILVDSNTVLEIGARYAGGDKGLKVSQMKVVLIYQ